MNVAVVSCPRCEDEWQVPDPDDVQDECRDCGAPLEVEEVAVDA